METMLQGQSLHTHIIPVVGNVLRVVYHAGAEPPAQSILIAEDFAPDAPDASDGGIGYRMEGEGIAFQNRQGETVLVETRHALTPKALLRYEVEGEPILRHKHTANGDVAYIENAHSIPDGSAFQGELVFQTAPGEHVYGLGQHERGVYNKNGDVEDLYQTNMKITVPFLLSTRNYGLLIDTESAMVFDARDGAMRFTLDTVTEISYYIIMGDSFDAIIATLRGLTGRASMLPRWAFGYIQSKERYRSAQELEDTVTQFRQSGIPMDCIVQDWYTWETGLWGEKHADPARYPNLPKLTDALHAQHARLMVSIWPNMAVNTENYRAFAKRGWLLPNSAVYNAFDADARALYWQQCEADWFSAGIDAWWCDNAEPFSDADWNGPTKRAEELRYRLILADSQKSMAWTRQNTYGLLHAQGISENWRKSNPAKRVVNLTRSTYISGQRYGVVAWSGDICAKWSVLRAQIAEGIAFCMSGMPYWTLDIGGFFTVRDQYENRGCESAGNSTPLWFWDGDYNGGVGDLGYRELYVRWLQYAAFLPMFRAHGTDTPREPWQFGRPGEPYYEAILASIRLRYRLMPYIYATAAAVALRHDTMLRSLMFDFASDPAVWDICDCFMFGRALLVCPVTEPMAYGPGSAPLAGVAQTRSVYLPGTGLWYDFWTDETYHGGQTVACPAPLERIPLFVRAGAILLTSDPLTYADERNGEVAEILVYDGADGAFDLYNDQGDGYAYENGHYAACRLHYQSAGQTLRLEKAQGDCPHQAEFWVRRVARGGVARSVRVRYQGEAMLISLA